MNWRKAPIIIREIRLAWMIPEIRKPVLATIGFRIGIWLTLPITVALLAVPFGMLLFGQVMRDAGEWLCSVIASPTAFFHERKRKMLDIAHDIMPIKEIQRRAYGEDME